MWTLTDLDGRQQQRGAGEVVVVGEGQIVLDELAFGPPARLVIERAK